MSLFLTFAMTTFDLILSAAESHHTRTCPNAEYRLDEMTLSAPISTSAEQPVGSGGWLPRRS